MVRAQDQRGATIFPEPLQRRVEGEPTFAGEQGRLRRLLGCEDGVVERMLERILRVADASAVGFEADEAADPEEPRGEPLVVAERGEFLECANERLLRRLVRERLVRGQVAEEAVNGGGVAVEDMAKRLGVAFAGEPEQRSVIESGGGIEGRSDERPHRREVGHGSYVSELGGKLQIPSHGSGNSASRLALKHGRSRADA